MAKNDNLQDFLTDVANAIRNKKGTTALINPQDFSAEIASISGGEPTPPTPPITEVKYLVQVIDYDGTVLKSAKLNTGDTFTLPDAPTGRPRLTFQEWSSPVAITNNTITVGDSDITIGATYTTTSGLTEFDITLTEVTGLTVTCKMAGTKNWGDGTSDATTSHTYSATGNYTITCNGTTISEYVMGQSNNKKNYTLTGVRISSGVTSSAKNAFYNCYSLTSITIPNSVTSMGTYAFYNCYSLTSITIPNSVTGIWNYAFCDCYSLTSITIPNSVTSIEASTFLSCYSLTSITIPNSVTSIGTYAFYNCYSLIEYDFSTFTSIPTLSDKNAFSGINGICKMLIPSALIDTWKTATNWSAYAKYMVAV